MKTKFDKFIIIVLAIIIGYNIYINLKYEIKANYQGFGTNNKYVQQVSVTELINKPEKFNDGLVRTSGIMYNDIEFKESYNRIFCSENDRKSDGIMKALWINFDYKALNADSKICKKFSGKHVTVIGTFSGSSKSRKYLNDITFIKIEQE